MIALLLGEGWPKRQAAYALLLVAGTDAKERGIYADHALSVELPDQAGSDTT